ncbi:MAG: cytochrome c biogenesis protein CcsA [Spirochaetes bacterium]|nr:cytochrome c biogenesis protein CcsA [Spirochaetota bacterium]
MISTIAFILLAAAFIIQIIFLFRDRDVPDSISHYFILVSSILLFITILLRSIKIRFVAVTNTFESLVFFAAVITLVLFIYRIRTKTKAIPFILFGGTIISLIILAIASSPIAPKEIMPPVPALQSYWLVLHVTFSFIGESLFVVGFVSSIYYLLTHNESKKTALDRLTVTSIAIGYPIFTAGALIFGAVWAEFTWGSYWSWDPKEVWALITFLTYTGYLHSRLIKKLKGKVSAYIAIAGFLFTLFTYFGVNFLLSGLHSYS